MQINTVATTDKDLDRKSRLKKKAGEAILKLAPEWKQRNLIASGLVLTEKVASGGVLSSDEQTELEGIKSVWSQIAGIRVASDQAEIDGILAKDFNP